jgi:hypothetical protein
LMVRRAAGLPSCAGPDKIGRLTCVPRGCDGIEWTAPLGSRILYRPDDGGREVH